MNRGFRRAALWDDPYEAVCGPPFGTAPTKDGPYINR